MVLAILLRLQVYEISVLAIILRLNVHVILGLVVILRLKIHVILVLLIICQLKVPTTLDWSYLTVQAGCDVDFGNNLMVKDARAYDFRIIWRLRMPLIGQ